MEQADCLFQLVKTFSGSLYEQKVFSISPDSSMPPINRLHFLQNLNTRGKMRAHQHLRYPYRFIIRPRRYQHDDAVILFAIHCLPLKQVKSD
jgi:hypothetical protein